VTELIVGGPLLCIAQHLAGLLRFLELLLGLFILRIAVRMKLHGKAPVGLLDVDLGRILGNVEDFVVVALCHAVVTSTLAHQSRRVHA
jgi:hypothetical protein